MFILPVAAMQHCYYEGLTVNNNALNEKITNVGLTIETGPINSTSLYNQTSYIAGVRPMLKTPEYPTRMY